MGICHRDIKPENILISSAGTAKVGRGFGDNVDGQVLSEPDR